MALHIMAFWVPQIMLSFSEDTCCVIYQLLAFVAKISFKEEKTDDPGINLDSL